MQTINPFVQGSVAWIFLGQNAVLFLNDSAVSGYGSFNAVYDADGRLVTEALPGGLVRALTYDSSGSLVHLTYTMTSGCSSGCVWLDNTAEENIHGQMVAQSGNLTQSGGLTSQTYKYDAAGRLIQTSDTAAGQCTVRQYEFSGTTGLDSNRTALKTYAPGTGGACNTSATPSTKSSSYDAADRLTNSGYQYDAFGRITTVPQADAGGSANMTAGYYVNDLARSITEGTTTQTLELDPLQRMRTKTKVTGSTTSNESYAYTDDSDSPAWIATDATWTRNIEGLTGDAELYQTSAGMQRVLIADLRGDTVAEGSSSTANQVREVDEFGVVKNGLPTTRRYGFHGTKQREALTPSGTVAMGVRLYVPGSGRFLQVDPVLGGSANPYDYANQDPVNQADLSGTKSSLLKRRVKRAMRYFERKGLTKEQAAGIVGNLRWESGLDPKRHQDGGGPGRGLAQWTVGSDRYKGLRKFASNAGKPWTGFMTQLRYVWYELNHGESGALNSLRGAGTVGDATRVIEEQYERPADPGASYQGRLNFAQQALRYG